MFWFTAPSLSDRWLTPSRLRLAASIFLALAVGGQARAEGAPFDLSGPVVRVEVSRGGVVLPLRKVPSLAAGDQITVGLQSKDLPHSILVLAFLRGAADPPPRSWFFLTQSWGHKTPGLLKATVPVGAEQALLFIAPATGGDFDTLVNAVSGRPGAFVRAAQDLNQSSRDRMRLDAYVQAIRRLSLASPQLLKSVSPTLARSLLIKLDADCLLKNIEQQAGCLTEGREALVLSDGRDVSLVQTLTSGVPADLVQQLSATPKAGLGYYSPYISSAMDIARLLDGFHTAQYQYIPALLLVRRGEDDIQMMLNTAPSFYNPKSVMVAALPPVAAPVQPAFAQAEAAKPVCLAGADAVLPVEGVPVAFATEFAHDLVLTLNDGQGKSEEIPVRLDPVAGGLTPDPADKAARPALISATARLSGRWGFEKFQGLEAPLDLGAGAVWTPVTEGAEPLVSGARSELVLTGKGGDCLERAEAQSSDGRVEALEVKSRSSTKLVLSAPLEGVSPGPLKVFLRFKGEKEPVTVLATVYPALPAIRSLEFHEGDRFLVVHSDHADMITALSVGGHALEGFEDPAGPAAAGKRFNLSGDWGDHPPKAGERIAVDFQLSDGRAFQQAELVDPTRPAAELVSKTISLPKEAGGLPIRFDSGDVAPLGAVVTVAVKTTTPKSFSARTVLEVTGDDAQSVTNFTTRTGLIIEDAATAVVRLDTGKLFDPSTHGPLKFRLSASGADGDWRAVLTLVRTPRIFSYQCDEARGGHCRIEGENLFLIQSIASDENFAFSAEVPVGLTASVLEFPNSGSGAVFLKLRDEPDQIHKVEVPPVSPDRKTARASGR